MRYPAPHSHNVTKSFFWKSLSAICNTDEWCQQVMYYPVLVREYNLILLLFYKKGIRVKVSQNLHDSIEEYLEVLTYLMDSFEVNKKYKVIQVYVKEVGHDIASSVQAILPKLRMVTRRRVEGKRAIKKVQEAELEIMSAYRIADTLGITVDPNYNIKSEKSFIFSDIVESAKNLCISEAQERHIDIIYDPILRVKKILVIGDDKALQLVLIQLIMNAIKYARGSTSITIELNDFDDALSCSVKNYGYGIKEGDLTRLWEFGYRGEDAKEMHVNGSGIGLYTVKKIIDAHSGIVGIDLSGGTKKIVKVYFRIPKTNILSV